MTTTILTWGAIYFVLWWLSLFIVLPFGASAQVDSGEVIEGTDPGAPARFRIWRKLLITTVVSIVLMTIVMWALSNPILQEYWS